MTLAIVRIFMGACLLSVVMFALGFVDGELLLVILAVAFCICPCALVCCSIIRDLPGIEIL